MKQILTIFMSLFFISFIISGCSEEFQSVEGQKEIAYQFTQNGSNENWEIIDVVSGTYWNIEKVYDTTHSLKLVPMKTIEVEEIPVSVMVDGELQYDTNEGSEEKITVLKATKTEEGYYVVTKNLNGFFTDDDDEFWNEKITIIIGQGDEKEEIQLK
ncbi:hypothetical protein HNQ94_000996 [Salirhabdus euzebyi]|uniref:Lipoprotein n=1 Tax=Salirhabdus euzebyi TaxID=394506 RepID=A0A841PZ58_9BACI|nr:hypothetical protein [Salirhabdus euzebyi]MBB6452551.1 hypothetical protein [Salirhabdus euzebyi]